MKNILIIITFTLLAFPFFAPLTEGTDFQIKGQSKRLTYKTKYLPKGVNVDQIRLNKDALEGKSYKKMPVIPENMIKDLSVNARSNSYSKPDRKAQNPLILFLNSSGALPEDIGVANSNLDNINSSPRLLSLIGLTKTGGYGLAAIQVMSKIGMTAALWGNPIVGAASSVVLYLAFNQIRNNNHDIYKQRKKEEDRIYYDIYKNPYNGEMPNFLSNSAGLNIDNMDKTNLSQTEPGNRVSMAIISRHSLMMLASRLADKNEKSNLRHNDIQSVNTQHLFSFR